MPATRNAGKRKITEKSPTKSSGEVENHGTPKKAKISNSPKSSPLRGPLQNSQEESPSFVAKCFYGLKQSDKSKEKYPTTPPKRTNGKHTQVFPPSLGDGKVLSPNVLVNERMLQRIAASPIKQSFLQTCSVEQFKKLFRNEFKEIEEELEREKKRMTRGMSRIVTSKDEEEESDQEEVYENVEDEVVFKISNKSLDCDESGQGRKAPHAASVDNVLYLLDDNDKSEENGSSLYDDESSKDSMPEEISNDMSKQSNASIDDSEKPHTSSNGKKFFKTRSPASSLSMKLEKGFNLKFSPKGLKIGSKKDRAKKSKKTKTPDRKAQSFSAPCIPREDEKTGNSSVAESVKNQIEDDDDLTVNKTSTSTYMLTPPKKQILGINPDTSTSPGSSVHESRSDDIDLLCNDLASDAGSRQSTPAGKGGSEDLFSSQSQSQGSVNVEDNQEKSDCSSKKLFPIFYKKSLDTASTKDTKKSTVKASPGLMVPKVGKDSGNQMMLDAGQKKFGVTQCTDCGMVYSHAEPEDENAHAKFHRKLHDTLKYPGWKKERVVQEYPDDCSKILLVLPDDPKYILKKVSEVTAVMSRELGFPDASLLHPHHRIFICVSDEKEIVGCCVAEPIQKGYRVIVPKNSQEVNGQRPLSCTTIPEPACVGISRIWVLAAKRRSGVATKLLECVRQWFDYGSLIPKHKLAFTDPTPDGRNFAEKYMGTPNFLVYKFNQSGL